MEKRESHTCVLCLKTIFNEEFEEFGDGIKEMCDVLHLKPNIQIGEENFVCSNCMGSIKKCFDFKSICLNSDIWIASLCNVESKSKLDLRELYLERNQCITMAAPRSQDMCRFCIKLNDSSCCKSLTEIEEDMLQKCLPELNLNLTKEPMICASCLNSLKFYFRFLHNYVDTGENIMGYSKFEVPSTEEQINLNKKVNTLMDQTRIAKIDLDVGLRLCEGNYVPNEAIAVKENAEFDADNVSDTKIGIEGNIIKTEILEDELNLQSRDSENVDFGELHYLINENHIKTEICEGQNAEFDIDNDIVKTEINDDHLNQLNVKMEELNELQVNTCEFGRSQHAQTNTANINNTTDEVVTHHTNSEIVQQEVDNVNRTNCQSETKMFSCGHCLFKTKHSYSLQRHILSAHQEFSEEIAHKCERCSYVTKNKADLNRHVLTHKKLPEVTMYKCEKCPHVTKRKNNLKMHMLTHQQLSEVTAYKCENCSYVTKLKSSLKTHMLIHRQLSEETAYKCERCSYATKSKGNLKEHMLIHRELTEVPVYKCETCSFQTKRKLSIKRHMLIHEELSEATFHKCEICSHVTRTKSNLKQHMKIHQQLSELTMHTCTSCSFKTKFKSGLKRHMLIHQELSEVTVYKCEICSYVSKTKDNLNKHLFVHRDISEVTAFKCESCSFETKFRSALKKHSLIHRSLSELIGYKCDWCSYETKFKSSLKKHLLINQNISETVYKCKICSFETIHRCLLREHVLNHRKPCDQTLHKCDSCSFETKWEGWLKRHMLTHQEVMVTNVQTAN